MRVLLIAAAVVAVAGPFPARRSVFAQTSQPRSRPSLETTSRWQILMAGPASYAQAIRDSAPSKIIAGCRASLGLSAEQADSLDRIRRWTGIDSISTSQPALTIGLVPLLVNRAQCAESLWTRPSVVARGLRLVSQPTYSAVYSPTRAVLVVGEDSIVPLASAREPIVLAAANRATADSSAQLRLVVPMTRLIPFRGEYPRMRIRIWTNAETPAEAIAVRASAVDSIWTELLASKPSMQSSEAAQTPTDRYKTRLHMALGLRREGDTAAARVVTTRLLREAPCLESSSRSATIYGSMLEDARPPARCTFHSPWRVAAVGALVPGLGQMWSQRTGLGRAAFVITTGLGIDALVWHTRGNSAYAAYLSSSSASTATANYTRATTFRHSARGWAIGAAALWAASAVESGISEWRHRRNVLLVRDIGLQ